MVLNREILMPANLITASRLVATPVIMWLVLTGHYITAAILFGAAAATDFMDGLVARWTGGVSDFGRSFDPLVDRIFILGTFVSILMTPLTPPWWAVIILVIRDLSLLMGHQIMRSQGLIPLPVSIPGKISTALLMISLPVLLLTELVGLLPGYTLFFLGLTLSVFVGINYWIRGIRVLKEKRSSKR